MVQPGLAAGSIVWWRYLLPGLGKIAWTPFFSIWKNTRNRSITLGKKLKPQKQKTMRFLSPPQDQLWIWWSFQVQLLTESSGGQCVPAPTGTHLQSPNSGRLRDRWPSSFNKETGSSKTTYQLTSLLFRFLFEQTLYFKIMVLKREVWT